MTESKAWAWEGVADKLWTQPSEESYYYAHKWQSEGRKSILDLGCGLGRHSIFFAKQGFKVTAVDLSRYAVDHLINWQKAEGVDILTRCCDMNSLPFADNAFDCVWAYHVISHTDAVGIRAIIAEIERVIKPSGSLYFTLCSKSSPYFANSNCHRIDNNTIQKTEPPEAGIPHYYADLSDIQALLANFTINRIRHVDDCFYDGKAQCSCHYYIDATANKCAPLLDYSHILGKTVKCVIDRPLGSAHPKHPDIIYPINYGYVEGVFAADGAEQDIYLMGTDTPVTECEGVVIAVLHRLNDIEDKWIVAPEGVQFTDNEILQAINFQEQFFDVQLFRNKNM